jgi:hypothetical protein
MGYTHIDVSAPNNFAIGAKGSEVVIAGASGALYQKGTEITSSAAELNIMDGVTAIATELNALDFSTKVTMATDFNGDLLDGTTEFLGTAGSGTGNAVAIAAGEGGNCSITTSSADAAIGANGSGLSGSNLNWRADSGGLFAECRLQINNITSAMIFFGFTDATSATVEAPLFLVTTAIDSDAADACGIIFDTDGTTAQWCHGGTKAGTDTAPAYSGTAPVNATDVTLRVEVSALGGVRGYINGTAIGVEVAAAVTITTPLVPIIFVANRTTSARVVLVDYLFVQSNRR